MLLDISSLSFKSVKYFLLALLAFFILGFIGLTVFDLSNPEIGLRLKLWLKAGLPRNELIISWLKPKTKNLDNHVHSSLFSFYKDQKTLDPNQLWCSIEGQLISKGEDDAIWQIKTDLGQVFNCYVDRSKTNFIAKKSYYDSTTDEWKISNRIASVTYFAEGEQIQAVWTCPVADPKQMLDSDGRVKENYLNPRVDYLSGQWHENQ
jgi:hypothetical protein